MDISNVIKTVSVTMVDLSALPEVIYVQDTGLTKEQFFNIVRALKGNTSAGLTFVHFMLDLDFEDVKAIFNEITK
jgi:hypothetical protein